METRNNQLVALATKGSSILSCRASAFSIAALMGSSCHDDGEGDADDVISGISSSRSSGRESEESLDSVADDEYAHDVIDDVICPIGNQSLRHS